MYIRKAETQLGKRNKIGALDHRQIICLSRVARLNKISLFVRRRIER